MPEVRLEDVLPHQFFHLIQLEEDTTAFFLENNWKPFAGYYLTICFNPFQALIQLTNFDLL